MLKLLKRFFAKLFARRPRREPPRLVLWVDMAKSANYTVDRGRVSSLRNLARR